MKGLSLINPVDPTQLDKQTLRIYEICDGCRRCFNLCPSFTTLLDRIDAIEGHVAKLTPADHHQVVDECYYHSVSTTVLIRRRINTKSTSPT